MADPAIGSVLAGYRIDSLIARGGMGVVYRATQLALDRPVALKVIARELVDQEGFRERFLRESRLAASLDHPSVVPVYDAREEDGELIVAMRLVEGGDLRRLIAREGSLAPDRALALLKQIAEALDAAHAAGIVHRDVKPHNILVDGERAYLSDFGLAKAYAETGPGPGSGASIVGTVEYMAPEQWRGERVGPAADVYALGCVLYEALTGIAPFARKESDTEPEMPRGIDAVIERAVSKDPSERFRTAGELIAAAEEREGATPAATQVLAGPREQPTVRLGGGDADGVGLSRWRRPIGSFFLFWFLGGFGVVIGLVVLALSLFGGDGVSVSDPVAVGDPPLRLAVGPRTVWVTSAADGTLSGIDSRTRKVISKWRVGRGVSGVTIGAGFDLGDESRDRRGPAHRSGGEGDRADSRRWQARRDRLRRRPDLGRRRGGGGHHRDRRRRERGSSGAASLRTRRRCASQPVPAASGSAAPRRQPCAGSTSARCRSTRRSSPVAAPPG